MTIRKILPLILILFSLLSCKNNQKSKTADDSEKEWIQLFNGKDLNDWTIKFRGMEAGINHNNTFRVENGLLKVSYDEWESFDQIFGHIFYKDEFSHYKLHVVYRFVGEQVEGGPSWAYRNNGLMLHGQSPESMGLDQSFPLSLEVQLLGGNGKDHRPTMNLCTPGTNVIMNGELEETHCLDSDSETYHGDVWVDVLVEVHGGEIVKHFVEGKEVMSYTRPQYDPKDENAKKFIPESGNLIIEKGTISLQAESHPIEFKVVELLEL